MKKKFFVVVLFVSLSFLSVQASDPCKGYLMGVDLKCRGKTIEQITEDAKNQWHKVNAARYTHVQAANIVLGSRVENCLQNCDDSFIATCKAYIDRALERQDKVHRIKDVPTLARLLNMKKAITDHGNKNSKN